jgi:tetratricopeptide (TPR) repeat protein
MATSRAFTKPPAGVMQLGLLLACASLTGPAAAQDLDFTGSRSVYGAKRYMSDGATALMLGNYEKGVELTQMGLHDVLTTEERTTMLSNLCAGYVGLKEFDVAVVYCNRSLDLDPRNWRALQNRAAAYSGIGNTTKALSDIEQGLELNPDSEDLKLILAIVRDQANRKAAARSGSSSGSSTLRIALPATSGNPVTVGEPPPARP